MGIFPNGVKFKTLPRILPVIVIGVLLSLGGFWEIRWLGERQLDAQFQNTAKSQVLLVTNNLMAQRLNVGAIQRFFMGSGHVAPDEFARFVRPFPLDGDEIYRSFEWMPRITDDMRETYETKYGGQEIMARGEDENPVRAPRKDVYFPIEYAEAPRDDGAIIGLDLSFDPLFQDGLERARDTASPAIVPMPRASGTDSYTFMLIYPVYNGIFSTVDSRRKNLRGFVSGTYCLNDLVDGILDKIPTGNVNMMIYDATDSAGEELLYANHAQDQRVLSGLLELDGTDVPSFRYAESFDMAGRTWRIVCSPSRGFVEKNHFWPAWVALGIGCFLTGLTTAHIHFLKKRSWKVASLVRERTEELDESRLRLQLALNGADLGSWDWHIRSGDLILSDRMAEMAGYTLSEFEPKLAIFREMIHPEDLPKVRKGIRAHLKGNSPGFEVELRLRHKSGHWLWVLNRGRVVERDDRGRALRACGTWLDITERKQVQKARELLAAAVEQVAESIVITDTKGIVQYVNPAFERITEYSREEVVGMRDPVFSDTEHVLQSGTGIPEKMEPGRIWSGVRVEEKKSGTIFYENVVVSPVFDSIGNIINYVCVKHDLTEQRRLEDERKQLELKYRQAQKMEAIGRLAGGVAHDLNNLLGPILGYSELIQETMTPPQKIRTAVNKIHYAGERARDVVSQLLAFGRKQSLSLRVLDIGDVIRRFEPLLRRALREDIRFEFSKPPTPVWIRADQGQIEQVLMNLTFNAQDAMPHGGTLTINISETDVRDLFPEIMGEKHRALLTISDTGYGMDEKILNNLFEPFFTTKAMGEGTGLGLAMVYGTVQQHNGAIRVKSAPGKGATFHICLPLTKPDAPPVSRKQADAAGDGKEAVMLVEDDEDVREMIESILTQKGYRVISAAGGRECLDMLTRNDSGVDLLLTDIVMPGMNGKELYAEAKKVCPDIKVIYMSGYSDDVLASHGAFPRNVEFIQKPFSIQVIGAKVRQVLDARPK